MAINIFEGARRIRLLLQALLVAGCIAAAVFFNKPYISTTFDLADPAVGWTLGKTACHYGTDELKYLDDEIDLGEGYSTNATLCFRSHEFTNEADGTTLHLIPFKIEMSGDRIFNDKDTPDVRTYIAKQEANFRLSPKLRTEALAQAKSEWWTSYRKTWRDSLLVAVIGSALLWGLSWVIGWIARGFAGIPSGQDRRPPPDASPN